MSDEMSVKYSAEVEVGRSGKQDSEVAQNLMEEKSGAPHRLDVAGAADRRIPAGVKVLMVVALATIACAGLKEVASIFAPAFFALTLVLSVRPMHRWLVRKGLPAWVSAMFTMVTLAAVLLGILGIMVWSLVGLPDIIAGYSGKFQVLVNDLVELAEKYNLSTDKISSQILDSLDYNKIVTAATTVVNYLTSAGSMVAMLALSMFFIAVDTMSTRVRARIVNDHDSMLFEALAGFEGRVRQYWIVSSLFGAVVAVINGIVLTFLHVPLPAAWAVFSFVTNYIPNIGFVIGVIPPALMGLLDSGWVTMVWVLVAYSVINAVIQGILQPKITGDAVGLSTTMTFLSLLFWAVVIGPMGAILAVPLTLFAKAILIDSSAQTRWLSSFLVPESEAKKQYDAGFYDSENPAEDTFVDFVSAELEREKDQSRDQRKPRLQLRRKTMTHSNASASEKMTGNETVDENSQE